MLTASGIYQRPIFNDLFILARVDMSDKFEWFEFETGCWCNVPDTSAFTRVSVKSVYEYPRYKVDTDVLAVGDLLVQPGTHSGKEIHMVVQPPRLGRLLIRLTSTTDINRYSDNRRVPWKISLLEKDYLSTFSKL